MKETILSNTTTRNGNSRLIKYGGKKIKIDHEYGNAYERFTIESFDENKWNFIAGFLEIGVTSDMGLYIRDETVKKNRTDFLYGKAVEYIKLLF